MALSLRGRGGYSEYRLFEHGIHAGSRSDGTSGGMMVARTLSAGGSAAARAAPLFSFYKSLPMNRMLSATPLRRWVIAALAGLLFSGALLALPGCQALRQVANLRNVDFDIQNVENADLAGVRLDRIQEPGDLRGSDLTRLLGSALTRGELPMRFTLVLGADNPAENNVDARLVEMDWTLLLEGRETISGTFDQNVLLPSGRNTRVPIEMRVDLLDFFERGGRDLIELALNVAGVGGAPKDVSLRARPTINTAVGPIQYPRPITINVGEVGGDDF
jgi:hypothetical protein